MKTASPLCMVLAVIGAMPLCCLAQSSSGGGSQAGNATTSAASPISAPGLQLQMTGDIEVGLLHDSVSNSYGDWNGQFVRVVAPLGSDDTLNAELVNSREFHAHGTLLTVGDTHIFTERIYAAVSAATSTEGFYLPTARLDAAVYEKWLPDFSLVTNIGVSGINSRDGHSDRALTFGAAYYFTSIPLVTEAGARINQSSPGDVNADSGFVAATYGIAGQHYFSVRYGFGKEAYQLIGANQALADFSSNDVLLSWRQWIASNQGFQLRLDHYTNPYYQRTGIEASWFHDF